jgi:hypothetical protein
MDKRSDRGNYVNQVSCYLFSADFLHVLSFDPEELDDIYLRNVGWISTDHTALEPRR